MKLGARFSRLGPGGFGRWLLLKRIGKPLVRRLDRLMATQSLVEEAVIFDNARFPWVAELEAGSKAIADELTRVLERRLDSLPRLQEIQPDQAKISPDDRWRAYFFCGFGYRSARNCAECPETARLLERVPGLRSAFFSVLLPGKHVPPHAGITKGLLRCHLALRVPRGGERCAIQVGERTFSWEEGRAVVFDDTYKHRVWNDTEEVRAVLLFDFVRPMRWPGRAAYGLVEALLRLSPYVRDARRNQRAWEDRSGAVETTRLEAWLR